MWKELLGSSPKSEAGFTKGTLYVDSLRKGHATDKCNLPGQVYLYIAQNPLSMKGYGILLLELIVYPLKKAYL